MINALKMVKRNSFKLKYWFNPHLVHFGSNQFVRINVLRPQIAYFKRTGRKKANFMCGCQLKRKECEHFRTLLFIDDMDSREGGRGAENKVDFNMASFRFGYTYIFFILLHTYLLFSFSCERRFFFFSFIV